MLEKFVIKQLIRKAKELIPEQYPKLKSKALNEISNFSKENALEENHSIVLLVHFNKKKEAMMKFVVMDDKGEIVNVIKSFCIDIEIEKFINNSDDDLFEFIDSIKKI